MSKLEPVLQVGGTLNPRRHHYIERPEDGIVLSLLSRNEYVNILSARQMGKSSMVARAARTLQSLGTRVAITDLAGEVGASATAESFYRTLLHNIVLHLDLDLDVESWWHERPSGSPNEYLLAFFREEVLGRIDSPVVIVLDEIDSTLRLPYTDDLFTAIRGMYNRRALTPEFERLTFCLLGVATPNELIKDRRTTPFNVGRTVELSDFESGRDDLTALTSHLAVEPRRADELMRRVLYWTSGQPFLTVRLCSELFEGMDEAAIDELVTNIFKDVNALGGDLRIHAEAILAFLDTRLSEGFEAFTLYERILLGQPMPDKSDMSYIGLKLCGLTKRDQAGILVVRNRIYRLLFSEDWVLARIKPDQVLRYRAFLSYSHHDWPVARRWHRRLEAFQIAPDLVGRPSRFGAVPASLNPIFRDRQDFPAGVELGARTLDVLQRCDAFILIASPNAANSHSVNEEVRIFRHRFPERPLVIIIEAPRHAHVEDCLPPSSRFLLDQAGAVTTEPYHVLVADPRAKADGISNATAKVVAGLIGLEPGDVLPRAEALLRQEARIRRGLASGAAALVLFVIIAGGVAWDKHRLAVQRVNETRAVLQKLEQLDQEIASGGDSADKATAALRDLLRQSGADVDKIPTEKIPGLIQQLMATLSKTAANPEEFSDATRTALASARTSVANLKFTDANRVLEEALARDDVQKRGRAVLLSERGRIASLQLHYEDAARFFTEASDSVAFDPHLAWPYAVDAANALYNQGDEFGDNAALARSIQGYRTALVLVPRSEAPLDWAAAQNDLGLALRTLGARESGTARLEEAVAAFRLALTERTQARVPLDWARTQANLGNALRTIGARESGTARLQQAVAAYRLALNEWTRDRVPLDWARTQNNLGLALGTLGERESGTERLGEAVAAYRAALGEQTRARVPLDWATTQNNLGLALNALGERESGTTRLEEAIAAYRLALEERTRDRVPLDWARTENNLGNALQTLGERESGTARLQEAVTAYESALEEITRDRVPLNWATTQNNLGAVLQTLGERESGTAGLEEAVAAYRSALEEMTRDRVPLDWARTENNLGNALQTLGERESDTARLEEAVAAYRSALEEWTRDRVPLDWARAQNNLGLALLRLGERESGTTRLEEAVSAWNACLTVIDTAWPSDRIQLVRDRLEQTRLEIKRRKAK
jgi:tetratricopeptide (TPR) repeat protein